MKVPLLKETSNEILNEIANETDKGIELAILLALSDGGKYTEKEIEDRVNIIIINACVEILRRKGFVKILEKKKYGWLSSDYKLKLIKMECPFCNKVWEIRKKETGKCPFCGADLIALGEKILKK